MCNECSNIEKMLNAEKNCVTLEVVIDLDALPGAMHYGEDAAKYVASLLTSMIPHYNPEVKIIQNSRPEPIIVEIEDEEDAEYRAFIERVRTCQICGGPSH